MHSQILRQLASLFTYASIAAAVGALWCGTQVELTPSAMRTKTTGKFALPQSAQLTGRGRRYYRGIFYCFGLALACYAVSQMLLDFYAHP
jgi:hypothetical protein